MFGREFESLRVHLMIKKAALQILWSKRNQVLKGLVFLRNKRCKNAQHFAAFLIPFTG